MCVWFDFFEKNAAVVVYPEIEFFDSDSSFGETWKRKEGEKADENSKERQNFNKKTKVVDRRGKACYIDNTIA